MCSCTYARIWEISCCFYRKNSDYFLGRSKAHAAHDHHQGKQDRKHLFHKEIHSFRCPGMICPVSMKTSAPLHGRSPRFTAFSRQNTKQKSVCLFLKKSRRSESLCKPQKHNKQGTIQAHRASRFLRKLCTKAFSRFPGLRIKDRLRLLMPCGTMDLSSISPRSQ